MSKIIVSRLKNILKSLISPCQTSFIPGRQSLDNANVCQELIHSSRFTKAKREVAIIKVDLEKA